MSEVIERLLGNMQLQLEEKDEEISRLQEKLEKAEWWADKQNFWRPKTLPESALPVPRLQIELVIHREYEHEWSYLLVYRHTTGDIVGIPMGQTVSSGSHRYDRYDSQEEMEKALPFRDGVHIRRDSTTLNLPAYAIAPGHTPVLLSKLPAPEPKV